MEQLIGSLVAGLLSGTVLAGVLSFLTSKRTALLQNEIRTQFERQNAVFLSERRWKEDTVSQLLGPMYMQLDRTKRAFDRWRGQNLFLEANAIKKGNEAVRDLLLTKAHLIPLTLLDQAGRLVEHYDRWLEEFEAKRSAENPDMKTPFIFVGPSGFPFPRDAEEQFRAAFTNHIADLRGDVA